MRRMMNDSYINSIVNSAGEKVKGLELLKQRPLVGSLAEADEFSSDEMKRFWLNSRNIHQSSINGSEPFPGEMMRPVSKNVVMSNSMLDLLVKYYMATYETLEFRKPFGEGHEDSIVIPVKMDQFGRCRIGSEVFGSNMSSRHIKSSYILAKFITQDGSVDCYPGNVQFFFLTKSICQVENLSINWHLLGGIDLQIIVIISVLTMMKFAMSNFGAQNFIQKIGIA